MFKLGVGGRARPRFKPGLNPAPQKHAAQQKLREEAAAGVGLCVARLHRTRATILLSHEEGGVRPWPGGGGGREAGTELDGQPHVLPAGPWPPHLLCVFPQMREV